MTETEPLALATIQVLVQLDASLAVDVQGDAIAGRTEPPFGTWGLPLATGELPTPTCEEIEAAVAKTIGHPVRLFHWDLGATPWLFQFYQPGVSHSEQGLEAIRQANEDVDKARADLAVAQDAVKARRGALDDSLDWLQAVIRKWCSPKPPLVEFAEKQSAEDAWRSVPVTEALLGLTPGVYQSFAELHLTTMGDFADFARDNPKLSGIRGLGEGKVQKILDAQEAFWTRQKGTGS